jgi:hypothetical protein
MAYYTALPPKPVRKFKRVRREDKIIRTHLTPDKFLEQWKAFAERWGVSVEDVRLHDSYYGLHFVCNTEETDEEFSKRVKTYDRIKKSNAKYEAAQHVRKVKEQAERARHEAREMAYLVGSIATVLKEDPDLRKQVMAEVEKPKKKVSVKK